MSEPVERVREAISYHMKTLGSKPTNLIISIDVWYDIRNDRGLAGILVPAEYSKDSLFDTIYGLTISILSNHNGATGYLKVL